MGGCDESHTECSGVCKFLEFETRRSIIITLPDVWLALVDDQLAGFQSILPDRTDASTHTLVHSNVHLVSHLGAHIG